jgi:hypothetical protein
MHIDSVRLYCIGIFTINYFSQVTHMYTEFPIAHEGRDVAEPTYERVYTRELLFR